MDCVVKTDYKTGGGTSDLVNYISKGRVKVRGSDGRVLSKEERREFVERGDKKSFRRQFIISPERGDELNDREMGLLAREFMSEEFGDRSSVDYAYRVHRDTEHHHVQVATIGDKRELYLDKKDLERERELARELTNELAREREQELERGLERDMYA